MQVISVELESYSTSPVEVHARPVRTEPLVLHGVHVGTGHTGVTPAYAHSRLVIHATTARRLGHRLAGRVETLAVSDAGVTQVLPCV